MNALFHMWNHSEAGRRSLEDVIGIIGHQMRACGHTAIHDPANDARGKPFYYSAAQGLNFIVEGFTAPIIEEIAGAHANGARFICIATEEPTDKGFNHGTQREMVWRQESFPEAAKFFDGILHLVPGERVSNWYGQFAPTAQAELGYAPTLVFRQMRVPEYDFGFYGSLTKRRFNLLKRLAKRTGKQKAIRIVADFKTQEDRNAAMMEAKVILQIRKFDEMGLVSSSRCNTAMSCGRPVVAEPHDLELSHPWDEIVRFTSSEDDFVTMAMLTARDWRGAYEGQFRRFKERLTPEYCIGEPLRKLGILGDHAAA
jgi:hypothetical protein